MTQQIALLDLPAIETIRKPAVKPATQPATETIHQTLARFSREAAENRAALAETCRYASVKVAKKPWICNGCGSAILPRQRYTYSYATGGVDERRDCAKCVELAL